MVPSKFSGNVGLDTVVEVEPYSLALGGTNTVAARPVRFYGTPLVAENPSPTLRQHPAATFAEQVWAIRRSRRWAPRGQSERAQ